MQDALLYKSRRANALLLYQLNNIPKNTNKISNTLSAKGKSTINNSTKTNSFKILMYKNTKRISTYQTN